MPGSVVEKLIKKLDLFVTVGESIWLLGMCAEGETVNRVGLSSGDMRHVIFYFTHVIFSVQFI